MKTKNTMVDSGKRHTLKRLIGTAGATATMASLPVNSNASLGTNYTRRGNQASSKMGRNKIAIEATLVSIPGTSNETLLLKNVTDKPITIDRLEQAIVTFDGETMDCGAVCNSASIVIPTDKDIMVHFSSSSIQHQSSLSTKALDVQAVVSRLPEGTRVIPLSATMQGTTATLIRA